MGSSTGIEWTDSTWNPVTGCTKVSAGCDNCYAAALAHRLLRLHYTARTPVLNSPETANDPFAVRLWPERLADPLLEHRSRMIFVNSMSDLFHPHVPTAFIREIFHVMLEADWHVFQVLTKRPARALRFWKDNADLFGGGPLPEHIWLGASVENQEASYRVRHLRSVPALVRFLSCEPLIGPLQLDLTGMRWVIVGGESGPIRRQMNLDWARSIRDECTRSSVPFFFKQVGGRTPKAAGRVLDGRTWDEYPTIQTEGAAALLRA
jgi:protein gp37